MKQIIMMNNLIAVDTNILIYLHEAFSDKRKLAQEILSDKPNISSQVISEYFNVCRRLLPISKEDLLIQTAELFSDHYN